jgi:hypothetical protein
MQKTSAGKFHNALPEQWLPVQSSIVLFAPRGRKTGKARVQSHGGSKLALKAAKPRVIRKLTGLDESFFAGLAQSVRPL